MTAKVQDSDREAVARWQRRIENPHLTLKARTDMLREEFAAVREAAYAAGVAAGFAHGLLAADQRARMSLDNCEHPTCVADRDADGFSTCAGGHLARRVSAAIRAAQTGGSDE